MAGAAKKAPSQKDYPAYLVDGVKKLQISYAVIGNADSETSSIDISK